MKLKVLIAILAVVLVCLLAYLPFLPDQVVLPATDASTKTLLNMPSSSIHSTESSLTSIPATTQATTTQPTTQAPTNPPTPPATQTATQPTTKPATKPNQSYSDNPTAKAFIDARLKTWICPVKAEFGEVVGSRTFASSRGGGKRAHAGLDFVAPHGTKVYAITSGTVQRIALFYQNTYAVEVKNDDGSILRYCEIATNLETGDRVEQGDIVGTILRADGGTEMLHMVVYLGDGEGMLTQTGNTSFKYVDSSKNYQRRNDLIDPTFLKDLPQ